ncbi:hypothetical protein K1719_036662 [Acacia pycnantha]|nr:hypothetical protein K1719_036662 [Acacia pycnantha]
MEEIQISSPLIWKESDAEKILIGKVLANKVYTRSTIKTILRKAWNLPEGFDVVEINGNAFMFKFAKEEEYSKILRGRPWTINGCLLNLMERSKYKSCEEFDFSRCPVWIQIHNVPLEALCLENAITIGGYVGEVMLAEDPFYNGRYLRKFLRARIVLDLRKPLSYGFWLPRPDSRKIWLSVRYEKLQSFCYNCGKLGHDNRNCNSERRRKEEALKKKSREDKEKHRSASPPPEDDLFFIRLHNPYMEGSMDRSAKGFDSKNLEDDVIVDGVSEQGTNIDKRRVRANELGTKKTGHCSMAYKDGFAMGTRDMPSHEILREHGGGSSKDKTINSPPEQNPQAMAMVLYNG